METTVILFFGVLAVASAFLVIFSKNTVHSALWMVGNCFVLAVLFLLLNSQFIAILQVIVYAGAIMMFILYAIMMLNLRDETDEDHVRKNLVFGRLILIFLFFAGLLIIGVGVSSLALKGTMSGDAIARFGGVKLIANYIFAEGLIPFELVSILLTAAVVGAVYMAKKN